jgi:hypothetical protein
MRGTGKSKKVEGQMKPINLRAAEVIEVLETGRPAGPVGRGEG